MEEQYALLINEPSLKLIASFSRMATARYNNNKANMLEPKYVKGSETSWVITHMMLTRKLTYMLYYSLFIRLDPVVTNACYFHF